MKNYDPKKNSYNSTQNTMNKSSIKWNFHTFSMLKNKTFQHIIFTQIIANNYKQPHIKIIFFLFFYSHKKIFEIEKNCAIWLCSIMFDIWFQQTLANPTSIICSSSSISIMAMKNEWKQNKGKKIVEMWENWCE